MPGCATSGTSTWVATAMPCSRRTARTSANRDANESDASSCVGRDPYSERPRGIPETDRSAVGAASIRSCAPRSIHRVSPVAMRSLTSAAGTVSMPVRSQPDSAKTPGCHALYFARRRCASRMAGTSSAVISSRLVKPCVAAMTEAVVHAIPFCVNTRLKSALPVSFSVSSARIVSAISPPVMSSCTEAVLVIPVQRRPVDELVGQLVVVLHSVHQAHRFDAQLERLTQRQPQELGVAASQARGGRRAG